jgi:hypothetical protein
MLFIAKDKAIPVYNLEITDDLSMYHQIITFLVPTRIFEADGTLEFDTYKIKVRIVSQMLVEGARFKTLCYTEPVYKLLNDVCEGYNGYTTLNSLFSKLGFSYKSDFRANNAYYNIPRCKVTTLLDMLTKYASFANGGGAHFYLDSEGCVNGYDYKLIKEKSRKNPLVGELLSENTNTEWNTLSAGEYEFMYWDNNNVFKRENLVFVKGYGKKIIHLNDTTGVWNDAMKQSLTNEFYNRYLTSRKLVVSVLKAAEQVRIGQLVNLNGWENENFIVKTVSVVYDETAQKGTFTATLVSNPTY